MMFAVDVHCHRKCFISFAFPFKSKITVMDKKGMARTGSLKKKFTKEFPMLVARRVIIDKEAHLMTDLLEKV